MGDISVELTNKNLNVLNSFKNLKKDWNGYGADPIDSAVIEKAISIIKILNHQPEVFPTACNSVQMEYSFPNDNYLEIEIFSECIRIYKAVGGCEEEKQLLSIEDVVKEIKRFITITQSDLGSKNEDGF